MGLRATNLEKLDKMTFDVLILGGGINGAIAAAALAARGARGHTQVATARYSLPLTSKSLAI